MSAAATASAAGVTPPAKGKKKLLVIAAAVLLVLAIAAGAGMVWMKKMAAAAIADDEDEIPVATRTGRHDLAQPPTFVPLETFVVNLADKDADRYAQIGITLEIEDPKFAEQLKAYMPAIRNGILMVLAHKTSAELLERSGKLALADEIMRETVRPLGIELDEPEDRTRTGAKGAEGWDDDAPRARKKRRRGPVYNPVKHVHFSNFIIQ